MAYQQITLLDETDLAASKNGDTKDAADYLEGRAFLDVTAAAGTTPTLDITIQDSPDGSQWYDVVSFTQATGVTHEALDLPRPLGRYLRAAATIGGTTPTFTFSVIVDLKR